MKEKLKKEISNDVIRWCNSCRLYAAMVIVWNAEQDELEEIVRKATGLLPYNPSQFEIEHLVSKMTFKEAEEVLKYCRSIASGKGLGRVCNDRHDKATI